MNVLSNKTYIVEVEEIPGLGSAWIVRVYRKSLFFRRRVSSDWFLDGKQAKQFAEQVTREVADAGSLSRLRERKPGWTLHRAAR